MLVELCLNFWFTEVRSSKLALQEQIFIYIKNFYIWLIPLELSLNNKRLASRFSFLMKYIWKVLLTAVSLLCCECSGYVSEVRRKNWKLCWPFTLGDEQNKSEEQKTLLPPLDAPKFRWWSCQSCLQEMSSIGTAKDNVAGFNSCIGSKSSSTCSQIPSLCDSVMPFPDDQQTPKPNEVVKRKSDVYTSTDANKNIHQLSSCSEKKEVLVSEANTTIIGIYNLRASSVSLSIIVAIF